MARATRIVVEQANPLLKITDINKPSKRLRVCAYARVSTDDEDQKNSYKAQVNYYTNKIMEHEDWDFVDVYTDEGISGTSIVKRTGFNKMIKMCKQGKIDLILTKSVSRFARNTVDSLKTCRDLKRRGVYVVFENDGIETLDDNMEIPLTFSSSRAQEESRSISNNVTWGIERKFESGGFMLVTSRFLGYDKDKDGNLVINEAEAVTVRKIFNWFLSGYSYTEIAKKLSKQGIKTVTGKTDWNGTVIRNILKNEKYVGNVVSGKTYTKDFLTHERSVNHGEKPMFYMENHHEAIISLETFIKAQELMAKIHDNWMQKRGKKIIKSKYLLSNIMVCGKCGSPMRRKTWTKRDGETETRYSCKNRISKNRRCDSGYVEEKKLHESIARALTVYLNSDTARSEENRDVNEYRHKVEVIDAKLLKIRTEMSQVIASSASNSGDQLLKIANEIKALEEEKKLILNRNNQINIKASENGERKLVYEYNDDIARRFIEKIIMKSEHEIQVFFKGGFVIEQHVY